ncbi:hypothetical protein CANMA_000733 [Candida margitis]|uniref:uncharacterized protein n=1 Tax=Candida margitis TaxID=1775924 RepID=UPI0022270F33|nr:uncharacterized protein CANMA_000733 [Candida margitis]KAI5970122.1 hypothetical protein CANMA_000733 [Candida margitis]
MLLLVIYIQSNTINDQVADTVSKKASDATLFDHEYALDKNWIEKYGTDSHDAAHPLPYSMSANTIQSVQLQQNRNEKTNDASSLINVEDHYDMLSVPKRETMRGENAIDKQKTRMQRWKSINDERQFMSHINESLLPPVLRNNKRLSEDNEGDGAGDMQGLEQISGFKPRKLRSTMTLDDWNLEEYNNARKISGYTVVPGVHHIVSDSNLYKKPIDTNDVHLLPPKESPVENIDDLSDIDTHKPSLDRDFSYPSNQSECAPSLHTYRKESSNSQITQSSVNVSKDQEQSQAISPYPLPEPTTPPPSNESSAHSKNNSPIKKFLTDSPRKIFRSSTTTFHQRHHNHSSSIASNSYSLMSGVSSRSRSSSPKKLKSYLKIHKHSLSVPNFAINKLSPSQQSNSPLPSPQHSEYFSVNSTKLIEPIDLWEIQTTNFTYDEAEGHSYGEPRINDGNGETDGANDGSRVSSLPSQAIGEYDREKWRTIKMCKDGETIEKSCV